MSVVYPVAMRRHRFIIEDADLGKASLMLGGDAARQLRSVLRAKEGDEILVCDGDGSEAVATIRAMRGDRIEVALGAAYRLATEPARPVTLYAAITKRDTFEWACQKATECGVTRLVPVVAERTVKQGLNLERVRTIVREAAEQSGRGRMPEVAELVTFSDAVREAAGRRLVAALDAEQELAQAALSDEGMSVAIGPEGGFTEREVALAVESGWEPVSLGPRVLRAETAVAVAAYLASR